MTNGRQHYVAASFIGEFGDPDSTKRGRNRPVWVARRNVGKVFLETGDNLGHDVQRPHIYGRPGPEVAMLERFMQGAEHQLPIVQKLMEGVSIFGAVPAKHFVKTLAPYVALILSRQPELSRPTEDGLQQVHGALDRTAAFFQMFDAITFSRRWEFLETAYPFPTTDSGWLWLPGLVPGQILIPLSPSRAVIISGVEPAYYRGDDLVAIPARNVSRDDQLLLRDSLILNATSDVYCPTKDLAEHARRVLSDPSKAHTTVAGISAATLAQSQRAAFAAFVYTGAPTSHQAAFHRFEAIHHEVEDNCQCSRAQPNLELNREGRRLLARQQSTTRRKALIGLPRRPSQSPGSAADLTSPQP